MAKGTSIEWTWPPGFRGATWNPTDGCSRESAGCDHCYAMGFAHRFAGSGGRYEGLTRIRKSDGKVDWSGVVRLAPAKLGIPLHTSKPTCWFVNSMSDLFHPKLTNEDIAAVFGVMAARPTDRFLILTKRAERLPEWFEWVAAQPHRPQGPAEECMWQAAELIPAPSGYPEEMDQQLALGSKAWPLPNVWLGVSVEDQQRADERIPHLLRAPAAVRFLSVEPQLGPVDLSTWMTDPCNCMIPAQEGAGQHAANCRSVTQPWGLDWVIVGGESGHGARPFDLAWARSIVRQCAAAGVACFVKQLGAAAVDEPNGIAGAALKMDADAAGLISLRLKNKKGGDWNEWPLDLRVREFPNAR